MLKVINKNPKTSRLLDARFFKCQLPGKEFLHKHDKINLFACFVDIITKLVSKCISRSCICAQIWHLIANFRVGSSFYEISCFGLYSSLTRWLRALTFTDSVKSQCSKIRFVNSAITVNKSFIMPLVAPIACALVLVTLIFAHSTIHI